MLAFSLGLHIGGGQFDDVRRPDLWYDQVALKKFRGAVAMSRVPGAIAPDDVDAHPTVASIDVASLCPNAEITVLLWKDPPELTARTTNRARTFLKRYRTAWGRRRPMSACDHLGNLGPSPTAARYALCVLGPKSPI
jgi:hypothetical protein